MKLTDAELTFEIANIENLPTVYNESGVMLVEPFEGCVREYTPLTDSTLIYHLQCKYQVSVDFRIGKCYIHSKLEDVQSGVAYFLEGKKPNRAILEAIIDAREEFL